MLKVNEVAFIAYAVTDLVRSRAFYEGVLGLKPNILKEGMPWIEYDLGATTLGIGQSPAWQPSRDGASVALEVENFEEAVAHLKEHNVTFEMEPYDGPICHMVIIRDPDGSKICIHKRKPQVAA
jgi:catechol 2,3-dioxygenase-like lactoylglutathione lyase family enzyme